MLASEQNDTEFSLLKRTNAYNILHMFLNFVIDKACR